VYISTLGGGGNLVIYKRQIINKKVIK
jgi:hypothetical protein